MFESMKTLDSTTQHSIAQVRCALFNRIFMIMNHVL